MAPWAHLLGWLVLSVAFGTTVDTGGVDEDGDGVTVAMGDCDDDLDSVSPELPEQCGDEIDNDCDGLIDEACDSRAQIATLRGGGCSEGVAWLALWPLAAGLLLRRRKR